MAFGLGMCVCRVRQRNEAYRKRRPSPVSLVAVSPFRLGEQPNVRVGVAMIMPDGSMFGTTKGKGAKRVEFRIPYHLAAERHDHLHFLPKPFRRP